MKNVMVVKIKATSTKASKQHNDVTGCKDWRQNGETRDSGDPAMLKQRTCLVIRH